MNKKRKQISQKMNVKRIHRWASKFIKTIEKAHKQAANSKLRFRCTTDGKTKGNCNKSAS